LPPSIPQASTANLNFSRAASVLLSLCFQHLSKALRANLDGSDIGINSFNEIVLSKPFDSENDERFRLVLTFITREVELAVSELSLLYVVDKHPSDTLAEVKKYLPGILGESAQAAGV